MNLTMTWTLMKNAVITIDNILGNSGIPSVEEWLASNIPNGGIVGFDFIYHIF